LVLMGLAFILGYPVHILEWAQTRGWMVIERKHVILFIVVAALLYLLASVLIVAFGDEDTAFCLVVLLIVFALKFVIQGVVSFFELDKWRY